jgi:hypothetical protein
LRLRGLATWPDDEIAALGLPRGKGYLVLKLSDDYIEPFGKELKRLKAQQQKRHRKAREKAADAPYHGSLIDLEVNLEIFYRKRSINANALLWSLYTIEADWANGNANYRSGYFSKCLPGHIITPQEIHDDDCEQFCEKTRYRIRRKDCFAYSRAMEHESLGKVMKVEEIEGEPDNVAVWVWKTTSCLDTKDFYTWTERVLDRIQYGGLLQSDVTEFLILKDKFIKLLKELKS